VMMSPAADLPSAVLNGVHADSLVELFNFQSAEAAVCKESSRPARLPRFTPIPPRLCTRSAHFLVLNALRLEAPPDLVLLIHSGENRHPPLDCVPLMDLSA